MFKACRSVWDRSVEFFFLGSLSWPSKVRQLQRLFLEFSFTDCRAFIRFTESIYEKLCRLPGWSSSEPRISSCWTVGITFFFLFKQSSHSYNPHLTWTRKYIWSPACPLSLHKFREKSVTASDFIHLETFSPIWFLNDNAVSPFIFQQSRYTLLSCGFNLFFSHTS